MTYVDSAVNFCKDIILDYKTIHNNTNSTDAEIISLASRILGALSLVMGISQLIETTATFLTVPLTVYNPAIPIIFSIFTLILAHDFIVFGIDIKSSFEKNAEVFFGICSAIFSYLFSSQSPQAFEQAVKESVYAPYLQRTYVFKHIWNCILILIPLDD